MSRIFKISFLLFAFLQWNKACFAQYKLNNIPHQYYQINQVDNKGRQGVWYFFDQQDSTVFAMQNFRNDTLNGYFERYWQNGLVSEKGYYKNGCIDSVFIAYWENGLLRGEAMYKNCKLHGELISFNKIGNMTTRMLWVDGVVDYNYVLHFIDSNLIKVNPHLNKIDTIVKVCDFSVWNKEYIIYVNDTLSKEITFYKDVPVIFDFYNNAKLYKRIVYSRSRHYFLEKIFYYENNKLVRSEFYNRKGKLVETIEGSRKKKKRFKGLIFW